MKLALEKVVSNIWTVITALVVFAILFGGALTLIAAMSSKTEAQEVSSEVTTVLVAGEEAMVEVEKPPVRICNIDVRGESRWDFDVLLATAEKYGCKVTLDPTPINQ